MEHSKNQAFFTENKKKKKTFEGSIKEDKSMRKITGGFLLLIIMVAFGNLTLKSEYQCVWNCARI